MDFKNINRKFLPLGVGCRGELPALTVICQLVLSRQSYLNKSILINAAQDLVPARFVMRTRFRRV